MQILSLTGETMVSRELVNHITEIDLSGLSKGIYFMKLSDGNEHTIQKIVVQ